jgi:hypothetical protein
VRSAVVVATGVSAAALLVALTGVVRAPLRAVFARD